jgi:hemoglobin
VLSALVLTGPWNGPGSARGQDPLSKIDRKDFDATLFKTLRLVINQGADLYNSGDWAGCYRLYEGALLAYRPLLNHHPESQKTIETALVEAARSPVVGDRAFVLRKAIDKVRADLDTALAVAPPPPTPKTLWERLGGEKNVARVVDSFLTLAVKDPRVNFTRKPGVEPTPAQLDTAKKHLLEYVSSITGGPLEYKGKNMKDAHKGMGITNAEFDAAVAHLRTALQVHGAAQADRTLFMQLIEATRKDIVQPRIEPPPATTLWERLGGEAGVTKIVDEFINAALKDPKVNFYRDPKYVPQREQVVKLKTRTVELISSLAGGPLKYSGMSMKDAHKGMGITNAEFDAAVGHLRNALHNAKAKPEDERILLSAVNNMRKDIVGMKTEVIDPIKKEDKKDPPKKDDKKPGNELLPPPKDGDPNKPGTEVLPPPKPAAQVSGKVTLDGKPLPAGSIVFTTQDGKGNTNGLIAPDGTYIVDRVPKGPVKIHITVPAAPGEKKQAVTIPAKYTNSATSGLTLEVQQGQNNFDIILKSR